MGLSQALSAALAGVNTTQQGLSVIAGNVANANTPGYVDRIRQPGRGRHRRHRPAPASTSTASTAISTRCCKTSCGPKRPAIPTPTPARKFTSSFSKSTARRARPPRSTRSTTISRPRCRRWPATRLVVLGADAGHRRRPASGAKSQFDDDDHPAIAHAGGAGHRHRRANSEYGVAADRPDQSAAARLRHSTALRPTLEDQRDQDITQLTQMMNVNVVQGANNQVSVFTSTGQQLVAGNAGLATSISAMSAPSRRPRCGAPIQARTAPARSRWSRRPAPAPT